MQPPSGSWHLTSSTEVPCRHSDLSVGSLKSKDPTLISVRETVVRQGYIANGRHNTLCDYQWVACTQTAACSTELVVIIQHQNIYNANTLAKGHSTLMRL